VNQNVLKVELTKGFILSGISAGGNIVAAISHLARDEALSPPLTGLLISIPAVVSEPVLPPSLRPFYHSWEQNKDEPYGMDRTSCLLFINSYAPDPASPVFSVLLYPTGHKNLPRTYFQICGQDLLRDDAFIYEHILREECGVETRMDVYPGAPHGFWGLFPACKMAQKWEEDTVDGYEWLLKRL
jgi:acetyl esterase/lipase